VLRKWNNNMQNVYDSKNVGVCVQTVVRRHSLSAMQMLNKLFKFSSWNNANVIGSKHNWYVSQSSTWKGNVLLIKIHSLFSPLVNLSSWSRQSISPIKDVSSWSHPSKTATMFLKVKRDFSVASEFKAAVVSLPMFSRGMRCPRLNCIGTLYSATV
jgi:hypothetical protein